MDVIQRMPIEQIVPPVKAVNALALIAGLASAAGPIHGISLLNDGCTDAAGARPVKPHKHTAGRNDPCPCGSGKKFKRCCLSH